MRSRPRLLVNAQDRRQGRFIQDLEERGKESECQKDSGLGVAVEV